MGDDGSAGSTAALQWARRYATDLRVGLESITVEGEHHSAAHGLLQAAAQAQASLLVVGRRGRGGFADLALGSTAHQVAEHSAGPVAVVPQGTSSEGSVARRILVGIDGSEAAASAAAWSAAVSAATGARVTAAHAIDIAPALVAVAAAGDSYSRAVAARVRQFETDWCQPLREAGVELDTVAEEGGAAGVLVHVSTERSIDLVVVGRTSTTATAMVMGSVAHRVVAYAPCAVVVVPDARAGPN